jgi:hypothetical protein
MTDYGKPYLIENINSPVIPSHHWTFNANLMDFMLQPLIYLEEASGPMYTIVVNDISISLPASWHIMVTDDENCVADCVSLNDCVKNNYHAVLFCIDDNKIRSKPITVTDFNKENTFTYPMLDKFSLTAYPVGMLRETTELKSISILCGPIDVLHYTKKSYGDVSIADIYF